MRIVMISKKIGNFNILTIKNYNYFIKHELNLFELQCSCGCKGNLVRHGYYKRRVKTPLGTITLRILRVKCKSCGKTHAVLPANIIPYSQVPLESMIKIVRSPLKSKEVVEILNQNYDITESDVSNIKRRFKKYWYQRLLSINLSLFESVDTIFKSCYSNYLRQFMQIKCNCSYIFS